MATTASCTNGPLDLNLAFFESSDVLRSEEIKHIVGCEVCWPRFKHAFRRFMKSLPRHVQANLLAEITE